MLALFVGLATTAEARGATAPDVVIAEPVTDLTGTLEPADVTAIAQRLRDHRDATGVQLAVLVIDQLHGEPIDLYAQRVFTAWGGGSAERNDGALFILALGDRENRLHLGYGLEAVISDAEASAMLESLTGRLRAAEYGAATDLLLDQVFAATAHLRPESILEPVLARRASWLLTVAGLGLLLGVVWLARPFPAAPSPLSRRKRRRGVTRSVDGRAAVATRRRRWIELALIVIGVGAAIAWLSKDGVTYWLAVPTLYLVSLIGGLFAVAIWRVRKIGRWFFLLILAGVHGGSAAMLFLEPIQSAGDLFTLCAAAAIVVLIAGPGFLDTRGSRSDPHHKRGGGFWSSSGSGSSYSGGGGSSGGGGASGRW